MSAANCFLIVDPKGSRQGRTTRVCKESVLTVMTGGLAGTGFVAGYMEKLSTRRSVPGGGPSR